MILTAACPAPVSYVPARSRNARFALARVPVPVEIREVPADAMAPGPDFFPGDRYRSDPLAFHAGALWSYATLMEGDRQRPITRDEFAGFVEGRAGKAVDQPMSWVLMRTPLVAFRAAPNEDDFHHFEGSRGQAVDLDGARRIDRDDRARAAVDLRAYLAGNVLLSGDRVFLRATPLAEVKVTGTRYAVDVQRKGDVHGYRTMVATPGSLPEVLALQERLGAGPPDALPRGVRRWLEECPEACVAGAEAGRVVNAFAGALRHSLDRHLRSGVSAVHPAPDGMEAMRDALRELEILALTGMACRDGEEAALGLIERAATLYHENRRHLDDHGHARLAAYVREIALPRLARDRSEDVEALAALGPGF